MRTFGGKNGNIVAMLMGTVAMVGIVGVSAMNMIGGPITTAAKVTHQNMAQNDLLMNAKVVVMNASTRPQMGDEDSDGYIEPVPFVPVSDPACGITLPTGGEGGCLPADIGAILTDPWGTSYAYCVWDHGDPASSPNRIDGEDSTSGAVLAIISAGPNKQFETPCLPYDGNPDPDIPDNAINPKGVGDDLVQIYTYAGAVAGSGGLWELKQNEPETAVIDKKLEIGDVGAGTGFSFDTLSGTGEFPYVKTDFLASKSGGATPVTMDSNIALDGKWLSGDGGDEGIFIATNGNVGIKTASPANALDVKGNITLGVENAASATLQPSKAQGFDVDGAHLVLRAGRATGSGAAGEVRLFPSASSATSGDALRGDTSKGLYLQYQRTGWDAHPNLFALNAVLGDSSAVGNKSGLGSGATVLTLAPTTAAVAAMEIIGRGNGSGSDQGFISFYGSSDETLFAKIAGKMDGNDHETGGLIFRTTNAGTQHDRLRLYGDGSTVFAANGSERMRITPSGNSGIVGIGTSSPTAALHVSPGSFSGTTTPLRAAIKATVAPSSSNGFSLFEGTGYSGYSGSTVYGLKLDLGSGEGGSHYGLHIAGEHKNYLSGNLGIGTTTPESRLHIIGAENTGTDAALRIQSGSQVMLIDGNEISTTVASGHPLYLNYEVPNNVVLANGGGNVGIGIGTGNPTEKLQVNGLIDVTNNRIIRVATPTAPTDAANKTYVDTLGNRTCANAQILKFQSGSWQCAADNSGGGGSDNLGNHTATQNLNMAGNRIIGTAGISASVTGTDGSSNTASTFAQTAGGSFNTTLRVAASGNSGSGTHNGISATCGGTVSTCYAIEGVSSPSSGSLSYGVQGRSSGGTNSTGVRGYSSGGTTSSGVIGYSTNSSGVTTAYGVQGYTVATIANSFGGHFRNNHTAGYGLYCQSGSASGCGGNRAWTNASDGRLKHHVSDLSSKDGLAAVMKLRPVTYQWRTDDSDRIELGFIAQEVEEVLPELVGSSPDTTITLDDGTEQDITDVKSLSYSGFVVPLVKAVQELKTENDALRAELQAANDNFRRELDAIKAAVGK